jgi:serine/threonine-protein kinase
VLGDFELLHRAGEGAAGIVYQARCRATGRVVALKVLRPELGLTDDAADRFRREMRVLGLVRNPNVAGIEAVGGADGWLYYTMPFAPGTLRRQLKPLAANPDPRPAVTLLATIARAVHVIHAHGIVHRDLKPGNILLTADGTPLVADFGLARWMEESQALTVAGTVMGTAGYMAPEQATGSPDRLTGAVDIWALGVILYELVTGQRPFEGDSSDAVLHQVRTAEPPPPRQFRPELDPNLEAIILHCLRKAPAERYATAAALADDLDRWLAGIPVRARSMPPVVPRITSESTGRRQAGGASSVLVAAAAVALIGGGTLPSAMTFGQADKPQDSPMPDARWVPYLRDRLARGEKAELIGPNGYARYRCAIAGIPEDTRIVASPSDRALSLMAGNVAAVELFPDPGISSYCLTVEACDAAEDPTGTQVPWVGVFFGTARWQGSGRPFISQCQWRWRDGPDVAELARAHPSADRSNFLSVGLPAGTNVPGDKYLRAYPRAGGLSKDPPGPDGRHWRRLVVKVRKAAIRLQLDDRPAETVQPAEIDEAHETRRRLFEVNAVPLPVFNPRGSVGIAASCATLYVRSFTITPMPEDK